MRLTPRQLNRATLARQMLLRRERVPVVDAVRRAVAVQAQEPASPYVALWNRVAGFDPADLDTAFGDHAIVKASLMRIALHAVHAGDYPAFHEGMLTTLRASRLHDRRFAETGLSIDDADALVPHVVEFASEPRTRPDFEEMLADRLGGPPEPGLWWALRTYAPLVHAPVGGAWSFGPRAVFLAAPTEPDRPGRDEAVQRLIRRYLEGFGPATAQDFAQFAMLRRPTIEPALEAMAEGLVRLEGPGGVVVFDVPGAPVPDEDTPAPPRLMAMWDSTLLAYADRSRVIPEGYRRLVIRRNGDVLPTLLVDGYVAGVWRPTGDGIEATAFHPLSDDTWDGLAVEAHGLLALLADRDPGAYGRYGRWWSELPAVQVRVLPG
jgi:hypothetical protein